jgi:hypothetical protein
MSCSNDGAQPNPAGYPGRGARTASGGLDPASIRSQPAATTYAGEIYAAMIWSHRVVSAEALSATPPVLRHLSNQSVPTAIAAGPAILPALNRRARCW